MRNENEFAYLGVMGAIGTLLLLAASLGARTGATVTVVDAGWPPSAAIDVSSADGSGPDASSTEASSRRGGSSGARGVLGLGGAVFAPVSAGGLQIGRAHV